MKIKKREERGFVILSLIGEMDAYDSDKLEKDGISAIARAKGGLILDFGELTYISSIGLRAILNIKSEADKSGRRVALVSLKEKVLEVFRISKLLAIFRVYDNIEDAIKG